MEYKTGLTEHYSYVNHPAYHFIPLVKQDADLAVKIDPIERYTAPPGHQGPYYPHQLIAPRPIGSTLMDERLGIHRLLLAMSKVAYDHTYPPLVLADDLRDITNFNPRSIVSEKGYISTNRKIGMITLENVFKIGYLVDDRGKSWAELVKEPKAVSGLTEIIRKKLPMTSQYICHRLSLFNHHVLSPSIYATLFKALKARSVYDRHYKLRNKALACAMCNIPYLSPSDDGLDEAVDRVGLKVGGTPDLAIYDWYLCKPKWNEVDFSIAPKTAVWCTYAHDPPFDRSPTGSIKVKIASNYFRFLIY